MGGEGPGRPGGRPEAPHLPLPLLSLSPEPLEEVTALPPLQPAEGRSPEERPSLGLPPAAPTQTFHGPPGRGRGRGRGGRLAAGPAGAGGGPAPGGAGGRLQCLRAGGGAGLRLDRPFALFISLGPRLGRAPVGCQGAAEPWGLLHLEAVTAASRASLPWGAAAEPKGDGAGPQLRSCPEALPGQGMPSAETPTHPLSLPCHFLEGRGLRAGLVTGRRPREAPHRGPWLLLVLGVSQVKAGSPRRDLSTCQAHYSKARNGATPPAPQDLDQVLEGGGLGTQQGLEEPAHFSAQAGPKDALWFQLRTACLPSGLAHSCPHICLGQAHVNHSDTTVRPRWLKESHESV